jgi:hypothetical protein
MTLPYDAPVVQSTGGQDLSTCEQCSNVPSPHATFVEHGIKLPSVSRLVNIRLMCVQESCSIKLHMLRSDMLSPEPGAPCTQHGVHV